VKKRIYRKISVKDVQANALVAQLAGPVVVVAIDVAKHDMVAAFATQQAGVVMTVAWTHPRDSRTFLRLLEAVQRSGKALHAVMEPSGTYGDAIRSQLTGLGAKVFRVSTKRTHDAAEIFDSVPSMHDAKAASILARLHLQGLSTPWTESPVLTRELKAALTIMELHHEHYLRNLNVLEALLSRHWPELLQALELTGTTLLVLLARIGGPQQVAAQPELARALLRRTSRGLMKPERIEAAVQSARTTLGVPLLPAECSMLRELAEELRRAQRAYKKAKQRVDALSSEFHELAATVGKTTAAVIVADVGNPRDFPCAHAFVKALGANLKERSSGMLKGRPSLSKRGPARARKYLWFAVLRWIQKDPVAAAWYRSKLARDGGNRTMSALGALMRKLAKALFHVARGHALDSRKLFDVSRLQLPG
jgi:transposase